MATVKHSRRHFHDKIAYEYDKSSEHVQSEGELLIRSLVRKQTDTNVQLHEQLVEQKEFQSSVAYTPLTSYSSGETSLQNFKQRTDLLDNIEEYKRYGLTSSEIELLIDSKKGDHYLTTKHKNICKLQLLKQIDVIKDKIKTKRAQNEINLDDRNSISRHIKEIGLCVKPNSKETKLFQFALSSNSIKKSSKVIRPETHPINHLKNLEEDLFCHLRRPAVLPLRKRREEWKKLTENKNKPSNINSVTTNEINNSKSKWDLKEGTTSDIKPMKIVHSKCYTCKPQQFYTIKDKIIVKLNELNTTKIKNTVICGTKIDEPVLEFQKLTENDIKNIHRFRNYEQGTPSKILYLKNIANSVKEKDLLDIFNSNKDERLLCRLLTGKMKGQAFITFTSVQLAAEAMLEYNGIILKGKPVVIQYGKSQS